MANKQGEILTTTNNGILTPCQGESSTSFGSTSSMSGSVEDGTMLLTNTFKSPVPELNESVINHLKSGLDDSFLFPVFCTRASIQNRSRNSSINSNSPRIDKGNKISKNTTKIQRKPSEDNLKKKLNDDSSSSLKSPLKIGEKDVTLSNPFKKPRGKKLMVSRLMETTLESSREGSDSFEETAQKNAGKKKTNPFMKSSKAIKHSFVLSESFNSSGDCTTTEKEVEKHVKNDNHLKKEPKPKSGNPFKASRQRKKYSLRGKIDSSDTVSDEADEHVNEQFLSCNTPDKMKNKKQVADETPISTRNLDYSKDFSKKSNPFKKGNKRKYSFAEMDFSLNDDCSNKSEVADITDNVQDILPIEKEVADNVEEINHSTTLINDGKVKENNQNLEECRMVDLLNSASPERSRETQLENGLKTSPMATTALNDPVTAPSEPVNTKENVVDNPSNKDTHFLESQLDYESRGVVADEAELVTEKGITHLEQNEQIRTEGSSPYQLKSDAPRNVDFIESNDDFKQRDPFRNMRKSKHSMGCQLDLSDVSSIINENVSEKEKEIQLEDKKQENEQSKDGYNKDSLCRKEDSYLNDSNVIESCTSDKDNLLKKTRKSKYSMGNKLVLSEISSIANNEINHEEEKIQLEDSEHINNLNEDKNDEASPKEERSFNNNNNIESTKQNFSIKVNPFTKRKKSKYSIQEDRLDLTDLCINAREEVNHEQINNQNEEKDNVGVIQDVESHLELKKLSSMARKEINNDEEEKSLVRDSEQVSNQTVSKKDDVPNSKGRSLGNIEGIEQIDSDKVNPFKKTRKSKFSMGGRLELTEVSSMAREEVNKEEEEIQPEDDEEINNLIKDKNVDIEAGISLDTNTEPIVLHVSEKVNPFNKIRESKYSVEGGCLEMTEVSSIARKGTNIEDDEKVINQTGKKGGISREEDRFLGNIEDTELIVSDKVNPFKNIRKSKYSLGSHLELTEISSVLSKDVNKKVEEEEEIRVEVNEHESNQSAEKNDNVNSEVGILSDNIETIEQTNIDEVKNTRKNKYSMGEDHMELSEVSLMPRKEVNNEENVHTEGNEKGNNQTCEKVVFGNDEGRTLNNTVESSELTFSNKGNPFKNIRKSKYSMVGHLEMTEVSSMNTKVANNIEEIQVENTEQVNNQSTDKNIRPEEDRAEDGLLPNVDLISAREYPFKKTRERKYSLGSRLELSHNTLVIDNNVKNIEQEFQLKVTEHEKDHCGDVSHEEDQSKNNEVSKQNVPDKGSSFKNTRNGECSTEGQMDFSSAITKKVNYIKEIHTGHGEKVSIQQSSVCDQIAFTTTKRIRPSLNNANSVEDRQIVQNIELSLLSKCNDKEEMHSSVTCKQIVTDDKTSTSKLSLSVLEGKKLSSRKDYCRTSSESNDFRKEFSYGDSSDLDYSSGSLNPKRVNAKLNSEKSFNDVDNHISAHSVSLNYDADSGDCIQSIADSLSCEEMSLQNDLHSVNISDKKDFSSDNVQDNVTPHNAIGIDDVLLAISAVEADSKHVLPEEITLNVEQPTCFLEHEHGYVCINNKSDQKYDLIAGETSEFSLSKQTVESSSSSIEMSLSVGNDTQNMVESVRERTLNGTSDGVKDIDKGANVGNSVGNVSNLKDTSESYLSIDYEALSEDSSQNNDYKKETVNQAQDVQVGLNIDSASSITQQPSKLDVNEAVDNENVGPSCSEVEFKDNESHCSKNPPFIIQCDSKEVGGEIQNHSKEIEQISEEVKSPDNVAKNSEESNPEIKHSSDCPEDFQQNDINVVVRHSVQSEVDKSKQSAIFMDNCANTEIHCSLTSGENNVAKMTELSNQFILNPVEQNTSSITSKRICFGAEIESSPVKTQFEEDKSELAKKSKSDVNVDFQSVRDQSKINNKSKDSKGDKNCDSTKNIYQKEDLEVFKEQDVPDVSLLKDVVDNGTLNEREDKSLYTTDMPGTLEQAKLLSAERSGENQESIHQVIENEPVMKISNPNTKDRVPDNKEEKLQQANESERDNSLSLNLVSAKICSNSEVKKDEVITAQVPHSQITEPSSSKTKSDNSESMNLIPEKVYHLGEIEKVDANSGHITHSKKTESSSPRSKAGASLGENLITGNTFPCEGVVNDEVISIQAPYSVTSKCNSPKSKSGNSENKNLIPEKVCHPGDIKKQVDAIASQVTHSKKIESVSLRSKTDDSTSVNVIAENTVPTEDVRKDEIKDIQAPQSVATESTSPKSKSDNSDSMNLIPEKMCFPREIEKVEAVKVQATHSKKTEFISPRKKTNDSASVNVVPENILTCEGVRKDEITSQVLHSNQTETSSPKSKSDKSENVNIVSENIYPPSEVKNVEAVNIQAAHSKKTESISPRLDKDNSARVEPVSEKDIEKIVSQTTPSKRKETGSLETGRKISEQIKVSANDIKSTDDKDTPKKSTDKSKHLLSSLVGKVLETRSGSKRSLRKKSRSSTFAQRSNLKSITEKEIKIINEEVIPTVDKENIGFTMESSKTINNEKTSRAKSRLSFKPTEKSGNFAELSLSIDLSAIPNEKTSDQKKKRYKSTPLVERPLRRSRRITGDNGCVLPENDNKEKPLASSHLVNEKKKDSQKEEKRNLTEKDGSPIKPVASSGGDFIFPAPKGAPRKSSISMGLRGRRSVTFRPHSSLIPASVESLVSDEDSGLGNKHVNKRRKFSQDGSKILGSKHKKKSKTHVTPSKLSEKKVSNYLTPESKTNKDISYETSLDVSAIVHCTPKQKKRLLYHSTPKHSIKLAIPTKTPTLGENQLTIPSSTLYTTSETDAGPSGSNSCTTNTLRRSHRKSSKSSKSELQSYDSHTCMATKMGITTGQQKSAVNCKACSIGQNSSKTDSTSASDSSNSDIVLHQEESSCFNRPPDSYSSYNAMNETAQSLKTTTLLKHSAIVVETQQSESMRLANGTMRMSLRSSRTTTLHQSAVYTETQLSDTGLTTGEETVEPEKSVTLISKFSKKRKKEDSVFGNVEKKKCISKQEPLPRLAKPAKWIKKELYTYLNEKLSNKYPLEKRYLSERLVLLLHNAVTNTLLGHPELSIPSLKEELKGYDICKTQLEYYTFFHRFTPLEFIKKILPMGRAYSNQDFKYERIGAYDPL